MRIQCKAVKHTVEVPLSGRNYPFQRLNDFILENFHKNIKELYRTTKIEIFICAFFIFLRVRFRFEFGFDLGLGLGLVLE